LVIGLATRRVDLVGIGLGQQGGEGFVVIHRRNLAEGCMNGKTR
jgi:hypothetical protein